MDVTQYADSRFGSARRLPGRYGYVAYFPKPIPRTLEISEQNQLRLADAEAVLGHLAGAGRLLPDPHLLAYPYLRREAVASTRIEGTQATLGELFDAEATDAPFSPDIEEVVNYIRAMEHGLERVDSLPLSVRLIRELHEILLAGVRGRERKPGELRGTQNWIGASNATIESAAFVPPPPEVVPDLLGDLERFVHESPRLSPLIQAGLLHYQFETIHPFLDGNGRLGRLLIVFFLILRDRLPAPLLYLSPYFEQRRDEYYGALQAVRERGDSDEWLGLFFDAVRIQAADAVARATTLIDLRERYRNQVGATTRGLANQIADLAFERPVLSAKVVEGRFGASRPAVLHALRQLESIGILTELPNGPRGQLRWQAEEILQVLTAEA